MSVFTPLTRPQLETFLAPYGLGRLLDFQGIAAGSENTNFFVSLEQGEFVLTLVERGPVSEMPFFIELLDVLHEAELPVPFAIRTITGDALREIEGKPALLQPRLSGKHPHEPNAELCNQAGRLIASIHLATRGERMIQRRTDRGLAWMLEEGEQLARGMAPEAASLLQAALAEIRQHQQAIMALPQANLHADLFRDNVMVEGNHISGVIDFYNACSGPMLYDVAISLNDWCSHVDGSLDLGRARAFLAGYSALRHFTPAEAELWPTLLRVACVRFWLSRLIAAASFAGRDVVVHDPAEFEQRLAQRQQVSLALPFAF